MRCNNGCNASVNNLPVLNAVKRQSIFAKLAAHISEPTTELNFNSTFELLIAVMLSAQATDKSVNIATASLFAIANTPQTMLDLGEEQLKIYIKTIGLFNSKAKNIIKTCALLLSEHQGFVPDNRQDLQKLPGVGRKTANVVLNTAFGQPTIAVDTHIFRLANRINLAPGKTPLAVERKLLKTVPKGYLKEAHHLLILHGRYTCTAHKPKCQCCCISDECEFKEKTHSK